MEVRVIAPDGRTYHVRPDPEGAPGRFLNIDVNGAPVACPLAKFTYGVAYYVSPAEPVWQVPPEWPLCPASECAWVLTAKDRTFLKSLKIVRED